MRPLKDYKTWAETNLKFVKIISKSINLSIMLSVNPLVVLFITCQKMVKSVDQCFPKPNMTSSNVLFCPQPKDNQFTVIEEEINQEIFTF